MTKQQVKLDVISGGHVEWHFHNKRVFEVSILFGAGMQNWKCPRNMERIAEMSGDEMFGNSIVTAGGRSFGTIPRDKMKMPPLSDMPNGLMGWEFTHHSGYSLSSMVLGELYASLDKIDDPSSFSVNNSIAIRHPTGFTGSLKPRPAKIKKFVLDRVSENDKQLISEEGITGLGIHASMMSGLRDLGR